MLSILFFPTSSSGWFSSRLARILIPCLLFLASPHKQKNNNNDDSDVCRARCIVAPPPTLQRTLFLADTEC